MAKAMSIFGMVVAAIMLLAFGLDLVTGAPFGGASSAMDIGMVLGAGILGYMAFDAFRSTS